MTPITGGLYYYQPIGREVYSDNPKLVRINLRVEKHFQRYLTVCANEHRACIIVPRLNFDPAVEISSHFSLKCGNENAQRYRCSILSHLKDRSSMISDAHQGSYQLILHLLEANYNLIALANGRNVLLIRNVILSEIRMSPLSI